MRNGPAGSELLAGAHRLGIIMLSAIGDAVHVLPVVHALKVHRPHLRISWVIQPVPHELVDGHADVDEFILFRRLRGTQLAGEVWRCARELRSRSFDVALGLQVYLKAGLLLWGTGAQARLGFDRRRARDLQWLFSSHRIPRRAAAHVQDQYFEFLDYLDVPHAEPHWGLALSPSEHAEARAYFSRFSRPVCGIVVGTSKPEKNWLPERMARVIAALESEMGMDALLLGGPSATEKQLVREIEHHARRPLAQSLGPGVRRLLWLLSGCDVVISPDTGPLHMARAIDIPVVGLYGYTNPRRTGPYRKYTELVVDGFALGPDDDYGVSAPYRPEGMKRVTEQAVLSKVELARRLYPRQRQAGSA